ncbi:MAG: hypothetical protein Q9M40_10665 [Sulfurimonas sp.]|nr:hypothetical protein [Sulfurimonas sp.]
MKYKSKLSKTALFLGIMTTITFSACSSGDGNTVTGILADGAIENARYECSTTTGFTNVKGEFTCPVGSPVDFYYGNIKLGGVATLPSDNIVLIQDILGVPREDVNNTLVTRLAVFLQSLDNDSNHTNGIYLDPALITESVPSAVDFKSFDDLKITDIFDKAKLIKTTLVKVADIDAQANLQTTTDNVLNFQNINGDTQALSSSKYRKRYSGFRNNWYSYHKHKLHKLRRSNCFM